MNYRQCYGLVDWIPCVVIIMFDRYWKIVHPIHHRRVPSSLDEVGIFLPWSNGVAVVLVNSLGVLKYKQWKMWPTIYSHPVYIGLTTRHSTENHGVKLPVRRFFRDAFLTARSCEFRHPWSALCDADDHRNVVTSAAELIRYSRSCITTRLLCRLRRMFCTGDKNKCTTPPGYSPGTYSPRTFTPLAQLLPLPIWCRTFLPHHHYHAPIYIKRSTATENWH